MRAPEVLDPYSNEIDKQTLARVNEHLLGRRDLQERLDPYKSKVQIVLARRDLPFIGYHIGDTHVAHQDSIVGALEEAVEEGEDGLNFFHANLIDSVSNKFISTNTIRVGLDLDDQEEYAAAVLRKAMEEGRAYFFGANTCHEGWAVKTATHDPLRAIVRRRSPVLYSGGQIVLVGERGKILGVFEGYHNSGKGRTNLSPDGSVRQRSRETPVGNDDRPDLLVDAHMHQLFAGQDVMRSPITRKDVVTSLGEVGASKGTSNNPDRFLIGLGVPPRMQPADAGRGFASIWREGRKGERLNCYPVAGTERGKRLYDAIKLWEEATATYGTVDDLRASILKNRKFAPPKIEIDEKKNQVRPQDAAAKSEGEAPLYKTLSEEIKTTLPISISFIGNTRIGSNSFERRKLNQVLKEIDNNPWAFFVATRRLINQNASRRHDREEILEDLANTLGQAKDSLLAIMLTDELRQNSWKSKIKKGRGEFSEGLYPGDWLHRESAIKGKPLIMPETVLFLGTEPTNFTLYLRDKLSHFTSLINTEHGLTRVQQVWGIDADALVGGHTEVVGWRTWMRPWGQLEVVVPGGFAEYMEKGIGNRVDYPEGGQGLILMPQPKKAVYSYATHRDGRDMHEALWLQEGLRQLGTLEKTKQRISRRK